MPIHRTADGRYLFAIDDPADGNSVFYDTSTEPWTVLADRLSYEAGRGDPAPPPPDPPPDIIIPAPPMPTGAHIIHVTSFGDGELVNRGYSYWPQAWLETPTSAIVFCGHADGRSRFWRVDLRSGTVVRLGALLGYGGTGEGWYWDREGWIYLTDGPRLRRVHPFGGGDRVIFSIEESHPGCRLWQAHSSDDGTVHSATVQRITQDGPYENLGTVVFRAGDQLWFPAQQPLDESQVTPDGDWLVIKEGNDNRIVHIPTGHERWIRDKEGAVGHSDCGPGFVIGEDDQHGACVIWDLVAWTVRVLFPTWNMGHISVKGGRRLLSGPQMLSLVSLEGSLDGSAITPVAEHGMMSDGTYDTQVFANLDHTGRVAVFMTNRYGRLDMCVLVL